jgi:hypothetical protein
MVPYRVLSPGLVLLPQHLVIHLAGQQALDLHAHQAGLAAHIHHGAAEPLAVV